jgi:hypothetical protein
MRQVAMAKVRGGVGYPGGGVNKQAIVAARVISRPLQLDVVEVWQLVCIVLLQGVLQP